VKETFTAAPQHLKLVATFQQYELHVTMEIFQQIFLLTLSMDSVNK